MSFYDYQVNKRREGVLPLSDFRGKVVLVVNTATGCGFTPQYAGLEYLYETYHEKGFEVLDLPCNQFGNQAPGADDEIHEFCTARYKTQFDQMAADAVSSARQELRVPGMDTETRKNVVDKICESLEKTLPWEVLGDTYMGRRQFYQLRAEFVCLVAKHLGMTDPEERRITKRDLKQYISQVRELDMLTDQINRMKETGENTERRKKLLESIKKETAAVESYVSSIRDSETRQIIMLKYMHPSGRMSWQRVANRMNRNGGMYSADYCRIKLDRFLKE